MPAPHSPEFRERAVALARLGDKPIITLAQELGISRSCLRNWLARADADKEGGTSGRLTTAEKAELARSWAAGQAVTASVTTATASAPSGVPIAGPRPRRERRRAQVREALGFREPTRADEDVPAARPADKICPVVFTDEGLRAARPRRCRTLKIEPPGRVARIVGAGRARFELNGLSADSARSLWELGRIRPAAARARLES
ncbi:transposase [Streptosporangium sp. NBC_01495]|uniref:transposase n=1 Tax=Streptosporangium sp. NBC_01495 TaxID=2903899 RepID=UPI002E32FDE0|nr:transposase [Streptosporangium sp. NBC_01495]